MKTPLLSAVTVLSIALAGCGDDDGSEALSGPATVMPADSAFYIEATIRPQGEQADDLDALLSSLGELPVIGQVGDPGALIIEQLESQAAAAGLDFSYAEDIEPWLGERIGGVGSAGTEASSDVFSIAVETTDEEAARDSLERLLEDSGTPYEEGDYEGVSYLASPGDEFRLGVFSDHVVFASQAEFEASVDASEGESLAGSDKLESALANRDEGSLATFFVDLEQLEEFASSPEDAAEFEQAKEIAPEFFEGGVTVTAGVSDSDQVFLDTSAPLFDGQPEAGASDLLGSAPGDALGAFALEDLGAFGTPIVDLFERAQEAGAELEDFPEEGIEAAFEEEVGVSFDDASAAIGDGSLWVRGDLPDGLEIAGEIEASDADVAADLIEAIEKEVASEGTAELGPPVGGSDVGFSALEKGKASGGDVECSSVGDSFECLPEGGSHADLPFTNIELDGDVIRYGFFADEDAATASDPDSGGDFADAEAYTAGQEALGGDFEYVGAVDLGPILDQYVGDASIGDAISGAPEEFVASFIAEKLGVVAFGIRYEDDVAFQRYVLGLASE